MNPGNRAMSADSESDPFGERQPAPICRRLRLLGGWVRFESNSRQLLKLVDRAYEGLPRHRLAAGTPELVITLRLGSARLREPVRGQVALSSRDPAPLELMRGAGLLGGCTDSSTFVVLSPREHAALVVVTPQMLRYDYHTRYELIEFAVFTLASRARRLIPLHAACVGLGGRGILLMGPSGAGKSTLALHCALAGFEFLSEDSAFVAPQTMLATGIANYLHIRADSLRWLGRSREAVAIRNSPVIQRRSGVSKFEVDLRREPFRLAQSPLKIVSTVFISSRSAGAGPLLRALSKSDVRERLAASQAYGANQLHWRRFSEKVSRLGAFELRRARHPMESIQVLRSLLAEH